MTALDAKPRILCLRPQTNQIVTSLLVELGNEWVETISLHADVSTLQGDVDLKEACETFSPDLIVVEALEGARPWPAAIRNLDTHLHVPRVLLLNCDPHNPLLPLVYARQAEYRFEAVFQFGVEQTQYMPELANIRTFSVPLFVDASLFRDYACAKDIPISIFSANLMAEFYPWRAKLVKDLPHRFPILSYTHPGYTIGAGDAFAVKGEAYARLLNRSSFSAADTTRLNYVVRKHLEIPASGSVLLAPESDALADYGFKDLENCILGTGDELYRKIEDTIREPGRYESIRKAGYSLVHSRYTRQNWTHLIDWLRCRSRLGAAQTVVQDGPLGKFRPDRARTPSISTGPTRTSDVNTILATARHAILFDGNLKSAAADLQRVESWLHHIAEPRFLSGIIALLRGQVEEGIHRIGRRAVQLGDLSESHQKLDPVELAWLWIAAHVNGAPALVEGMRQQAEGVSHLSLRRARWLLEPEKASRSGSDHDLDRRRPDDVLSTRWMGQEPFALWCSLVERIYAASAQAHRIPDVLQERIARQTAVLGAA